MDDNIIKNQISDDELDKLLGSHFKDSLVEPPIGFTNGVMSKLSAQKQGGQFDPIMLIVLLTILIINALVIALPYILPNQWLQKVANVFQIATFSSISSVSLYLVSAVLLGIVFVVLDFFLSRRLESSDTTFA
jgi:hypothetical protein